jgi:signal transduction histidine kinase/ActR/RegA family two-component response regulator
MMIPSRILLLWTLLFVGICHSQSNGYSKKEITALTDTADQYLVKLKFKESLLYSREALKRAVYIKDDYLIATAYNTIAGNFDELSENDKAIANYKKGLFYASRTDNDSIKGWLNNNLGNMYFFEKKDYQKGIDFYNTSIEYAEKTKDTSRLVFTHLNLALAYFEIGNYKQGLPHLQFINKYHGRHGDSSTVVFLNMLNGIYCGYTKQDTKAEAYFAKAIEIAKKDKNDLDLGYTYQEYARFLKDRGQYREAYKYLDMYNNIKDEIYNADKLRGADIEGVNFQLDEYKRALEKIETEKKIQSFSLKKSRTILLLFVIGLAVLLILLYTLYKNNNFRKKMNTELRKTNSELQRAKEKAEEASQLKSQFVSTISHELRTPLYGVVGITNMILDEHKELAGSMHLNSLKFSAKYLLSLVNDILQINKIEENRLTLERLTFNISDEITTIKNSLQFIANKNKNNIIVEIDTDIPEFVIGDKLRLSQIFMNLVSNALKFTKNGEVVISANLDKVIAKMHYIRFTVRDNGIGIAAQDQDKIFEKFVQIERKSDDYQGTGLGLPIVKRLIAVFGSEIHMESVEGEGTTFTFTIGFEVDPEKTKEIIDNIEVDMSNGQIFNILVVEDNKINQVVTKKIIENNNYRCRMVDDGYGALEVLRNNNPYDIILMDINMPGIDGFETTREIRKLGITTPVIALTAFGKDEIAEEAISSGMNDIIIKPFEPVKLFRIISGLISQAKNAD